LAIGGAAVIGVLLFNRFQEGKAKREAERAFGSGRPDVLLGEKTSPIPPAPASARSEPVEATAEAMPDDNVDYVIDVLPARPQGARTVLEAWVPLERRFARRAALVASWGGAWRRLRAGDAGECERLCAALQLVSRSGVVPESELVEFRSAVETLATGLGATVVAPEMRPALDAARRLDAVCADADIQIALHVVGGATPQKAPAEPGQPFHAALQDGGVVFTLDVPRVPEVGRAYEAMTRAAAHLAAASGGRIADDNGNALDERALASIGAQLDGVRRSLAEAGIETGSPLALRLFS
jgi:hypothetical protein